MKKLIFIILILPLLICSAQAEGTSPYDEYPGNAQAVEEGLSEEEREVSGELKLDGSYDSRGALARLWDRLISGFRDAVRNELSFALKLISLAFFSAAAASVCSGEKIPEYINIIAACTLAYIISGSVEGIVLQAMNTLYRLSDYSKAAMPAIFTAAAACGAVSSASVKYASACLAMDIFMTAAGELILPLIRAYTALSLSSAVFDNSVLKAASKFSRSAAVLMMSGICIAFSAYIGISGLIAGSTDAIAVKTAKTVISTSLPVVGGIISDAASVVLASASLIKNSAGVFSLIAICAMCAGPFAVLSVKMLVFKAVAAASDMLPGGKIASLLNSMGSTMAMLLGLIGSCGIMLFISIMSGIRAVSQV